KVRRRIRPRRARAQAPHRRVARHRRARALHDLLPTVGQRRVRCVAAIPRASEMCKIAGADPGPARPTPPGSAAMAGPFTCPTCHLDLAAPAASCEQHLRDEIKELRGRLAQAEAQHATALEAVRHTEAQFHAFLNNSPCVAFVRDLEGRLIYHNEPYRRVLQRGKESMLGTTDGERFPPEVSEQLRRNNELVWKSNRPIEVIEEVPGADGVLRPWLVFKFPVPDAAGRRLLGGVAIDISERRRVEEQLRESE